MSKGGVYMKKFIEEFKAFAFKGNIVDMAVGVIIGTAFGKIVTSLVNNLIMPLFGAIGGFNFEELKWVLNGSEITYGVFVQNVVDFFIIAVTIFIVIKILSSLHKKKEEEIKEEKPKKEEHIVLLEKILKELKKDK